MSKIKKAYYVWSVFVVALMMLAQVVNMLVILVANILDEPDAAYGLGCVLGFLIVAILFWPVWHCYVGFIGYSIRNIKGK